MLHNLVSVAMLWKLRSACAIDPTLLDYPVPTPEQVSDYFMSLRTLTQSPLSYRLLTSDRNLILVVSQTLPIEHHELARTLNLALVSTDYTWRCACTFEQGWANPKRVFRPDLVPHIIPLFDKLQRHLLCARPAYLHQIRRNDNVGTHGNVITVEVAPRYKADYELQVGLLEERNSWPNAHMYERRRCTQAEATIWAVLSMLPTRAELDDVRLHAIRRAIRTAATGEPFGSLSRSPGHLYNLLSIRHASYQDGRARYPLIYAAATDESLLADYACSHPLESPPPAIEPPKGLPKSKFVLPQVLSVLLLALLTSAPAFLYLLRLRNAPSEHDTTTLAFTMFMGLLTPVYLFWHRVLRGDSESTFSMFRPITAPELVRYAQRCGRRAQVEAACSSVARQHFNGDWLGFCAKPFAGASEYTARKFRISDLVRAGYLMGYARDGREVLVTPDSDTLRLVAVTKDPLDPRAIFEKMDENCEERKRYQPGLEGRWAADLEIGCRRELGGHMVS